MGSITKILEEMQQFETKEYSFKNGEEDKLIEVIRADVEQTLSDDYPGGEYKVSGEVSGEDGFSPEESRWIETTYDGWLSIETDKEGKWQFNWVTSIDDIVSNWILESYPGYKHDTLDECLTELKKFINDYIDTIDIEI